MVANFSQKTNGQIWFVCFFTLHGKQIKFVHSFFWENLQLASLLFGFMWPLLALFASYSISKFPTYSFISLYVLFLWYLVKISTLLEYTRLYWPYLFNWHLRVEDTQWAIREIPNSQSLKPNVFLDCVFVCFPAFVMMFISEPVLGLAPKSWVSKGQIISKGLLVPSNSPQKRTNEFVVTTTT